MAPGQGAADEKVPENVDRAFLGYAQFEMNDWNWTLGVHCEDPRAKSSNDNYDRSRTSFNRIDGGARDYNNTFYYDNFYPGTHAALGGAPMQGDNPAGHSLANDIEQAEKIDREMRANARAAGINIRDIPKHGYETIAKRRHP